MITALSTGNPGIFYGGVIENFVTIKGEVLFMPEGQEWRKSSIFLEPGFPARVGKK